jgi:hypothetical protein
MKITEERFMELLVDRIGELPRGYLIEKKLTVLYDLSISQDGNIHMGVDLDSGYPIRGKGKGFEQDIVIYRKLENAHTAIIPYIIAEVKYQSVTTHDAIVYSKKAEKIRSVYPYVRYGLILGNFRSIPGRVIRHGESFDFITAIQYPFSEESVEELRKLLLNELHTSENMESIRSSKKKIITIQKKCEYREI